MKKIALSLWMIHFQLIGQIMGQTHHFPTFGAQIWIEPGQTQSQIQHWIKTLSEAKMPVVRIFIQWNYVQKDASTWDWTLYDWLFDATDQYNLQVVATLTTNQYPPALEEYMYFKTQASSLQATFYQLELAQKYISQAVNRYKNRKSLYAWMLHNEPGQLPEAHEISITRFQEYLKTKYTTIQQLNEKWNTAYSDFSHIQYSPFWDKPSGFSVPSPYLDWNFFWREHLTWYMNWIATEIRKHDTTHILHTNPHSVFENMRLYELPKWRNFLDIQGASIHPSWHFGMLKREQYTLGISATCEILRGTSEPKPFWISELQGGNNTYSGTKPLCPTAQDIAQWLWIGVASGATKIIYWCLNYRQFGTEAAEWSLLDFQSRPSERLLKTTQIAQIIENQKDFFEKAQPSQSDIYILLSSETMMILQRKSYNDIAARHRDAHMIAALAYYQALMQIGIAAHFKMVDDFNWESGNSPKIVILPHVVAMSLSQIEKLEKFVRNGNKLIISGLTGIFDENESSWLTRSPQPMENFLGARLKEIRLTSEKDEVSIKNIQLPLQLWVGEIEILDTTKIQIVGYYTKPQKYPIAIRKKYEKGEILWIPSMLDNEKLLADASPLSRLLMEEVSFVRTPAFRFKNIAQGVVMRYLQKENEFVTVFTNSCNFAQNIQISAPKSLTPKLIYGTGKEIWQPKNQTVHIPAYETIVMKWE
ncbi:MAG: beta-galactosidase [Cytophagales bacterium]|nr:beta-galactosidase [Cytophagales bacterium]MDW8384048.1 beta-galactosidase [Flammeovirgaceae bacterium]